VAATIQQTRDYEAKPTYLTDGRTQADVGPRPLPLQGNTVLILNNRNNAAVLSVCRGQDIGPAIWGHNTFYWNSLFLENFLENF